ncbi:MAG: hypothetical protein JXX28_05305 [Deltaproteobacteria bacterium]|nr:hypothetical protein [Deltaproteobacteria bacterium]
MSTQFLVRYEYAARSADNAAINRRWAVRADGAFIESQNPEGAVRPDDAKGLFWFATEWEVDHHLSDFQLEEVRAYLAANPLLSAQLSAAAPSPEGGVSRLTVSKGDDRVVLIVEDQAEPVFHAWLDELTVRIWSDPDDDSTEE